MSNNTPSHSLHAFAALCTLCAWGMLLPATACADAASSDADALSLELPSADDNPALSLELPASPEAETPTAPRKLWTLSAELAQLHVEGRDPWPDRDVLRFAAALRGQQSLSPAVNLRYAARIDAYDRYLAVLGTPYKRSGSLQELYGQYLASPDVTLQLGRIDVREGSAFSFNPVDVYRTGSVKMFVNPSPLVTRESRQGTWAARSVWTHVGGSTSLTYSPKLASPYPSRAWTLDNGQTNAAHSLFGVWSHSVSESASVKLTSFKASDRRWQLGSSGSALASPAITLHYEVAHGRLPTLSSPMAGSDSASIRTAIGTQAVLGGTWTAGRWSWTLEHSWNSLAVSDSTFAAAAAGQQAGWAYSYLSATEQLQMPGARRQWFLYVSRPDLFMPRLDFKAFVRQSPGDHGVMAWLELRKRMSGGTDISYQWLGTSGSQHAMLGMMPARQIHQLVLTQHF